MCCQTAEYSGDSAGTTQVRHGFRTHILHPKKFVTPIFPEGPGVDQEFFQRGFRRRMGIFFRRSRSRSRTRNSLHTKTVSMRLSILSSGTNCLREDYHVNISGDISEMCHVKSGVRKRNTDRTRAYLCE